MIWYDRHLIPCGGGRIDDDDDDDDYGAQKLAMIEVRKGRHNFGGIRLSVEVDSSSFYYLPSFLPLRSAHQCCLSTFYFCVGHHYAFVFLFFIFHFIFLMTRFLQYSFCCLLWTFKNYFKHTYRVLLSAALDGISTQIKKKNKKQQNKLYYTTIVIIVTIVRVIMYNFTQG